MKLGKFELTFVLIILIVFTSNALGKHLTTNKKIDSYNTKDNAPRNLQGANNYDSYITLKYNEDSKYPNGFKNAYRNDISYIKNKESNSRIPAEAKLDINKDFRIEIHFSSPVTSLAYFFDKIKDENMQYLESVDFTNFDSSLVTNMNSMFYGCNSLKSITFTNYNTNKVITMNSLFYGCSSIESLNLSSFNTSLVTNMNNLFYGCTSLKILDISNFNMANCNSYKNMFYNANNIKYINLYNCRKECYDKLSILNETNNNIFICQKYYKNTKINYCCDYDLKNNSCNSNRNIPAISLLNNLNKSNKPDKKRELDDKPSETDKTRVPEESDKPSETDKTRVPEETDKPNETDKTRVPEETDKRNNEPTYNNTELDDTDEIDKYYIRTKESSSKLSTGAIVGIVIGAVVFIGIIIGISCACK